MPVQQTVTVTLQQVVVFLDASNRYLGAHKEESKLSYALKKVGKSLEKVLTKYQEDRVEAEIDCCSEDERKNIIRDANGNLSFTKDGLRQRNVKFKALLAETVLVAPHYVGAPEGLEEFYIEAFTPFVLEPVEVSNV